MLNIDTRRTAGEAVQTALGMGGAEQAQETELHSTLGSWISQRPSQVVPLTKLKMEEGMEKLVPTLEAWEDPKLFFLSGPHFSKAGVNNT